MRNWYEALCEDFEIDLLELRKTNTTSIGKKSLRTYSKEGNSPRNKAAKKGILALVRIKHSSFREEQLQDYFDNKYAKKPTDATRLSCINNIQKALEFAEQEGIGFDSPHDQPEQIAEWVFDSFSLPDGLDTTGLFLENTRSQIKTKEQLDKVKELHNTIAPLFIVNEEGIESALQKPLELTGMDSSSGPASAACAISRFNGHPQSLKMELGKEGEYQFSTPENAVVEKSFAPEDGELKKRIAHRLSQKHNLISHSKTYAEDKDNIDEKRYENLRLKGKIKLKSINTPFIYLANTDDAYPHEQLIEVSDFPNVYCFANAATESISIYGDETSYIRLHDMYADLLNISDGLKTIIDVRTLIATLPEVTNADLLALKQTAEQLNDQDFIEQLDKITSVLSNTTQGVANLPEAMNTGLSLYEKAEALFTYITANASVFGS